MDYLKEILPGFDFGQFGSRGASARLADSEDCDTLNWINVNIHIYLAYGEHKFFRIISSFT